MNRTDIIRQHLVDYCELTGMVAEEHDEASWAALEGDYRKPLGFQGPDPARKFAAPFCPSIIDDTTQQLDDKFLDEYLHAVEYVLGAEVQFYKLDPEGRRSAAENKLINANADALRLISEVHAELLDRTAGSTA